VQQASADLPDLLSRVKELMKHEDFTLKNPNRLRSVVTSFAGCQHKFHAIDGSGYQFMGDMVLEVDKLNPQVGGRLLRKSTHAGVESAMSGPSPAAAPIRLLTVMRDRKQCRKSYSFYRLGFLAGCERAFHPVQSRQNHKVTTPTVFLA